jgi:hypothetical protein
MDRSVPLVAHRDGVLRVFLRANTPNNARPAVRVTLLDGGGPWTRTIPAPANAVPTGFDELDPAASWNLPIPGDALVPGARIRLEVDPDHQLPGVTAGARLLEAPLDLRVVPPIRITLVPVRQAATGLTGVVVGPGRTLDSWTEVFRKLYPLAAVEVQAGATLTTTAVLDGHGPHQDVAWTQLLGELEQRRDAAWAAGETGRYFYGVVRRSHGQGTLGLTPVQSPVASGWDDPAGYQTTFAHEMGHALGRAHAPYNLPPNEPLGDWPVADPAYARASLGAAGMDPATGLIKPPNQFKDIMSYAPPVRMWVSDHTYRAVLDWRAANPAPLPPRPVITAIHPATGAANTHITVTGQFLETAIEVQFVSGGVAPVPANFDQVTATELRVTVPNPAPTGQLRVRTPGGQYLSATLFIGIP